MLKHYTYGNIKTNNEVHTDKECCSDPKDEIEVPKGPDNGGRGISAQYRRIEWLLKTFFQLLNMSMW
jgi:hypothetical protein